MEGCHAAALMQKFYFTPRRNQVKLGRYRTLRHQRIFIVISAAAEVPADATRPLRGTSWNQQSLASRHWRKRKSFPLRRIYHRKERERERERVEQSRLFAHLNATTPSNLNREGLVFTVETSILDD